MVVVCSVYKCKNKQKSVDPEGRPISFHRFPSLDRSPGLYKQWLHKLSRANFKPSRCTYVCSDHFVEDDYELSSKFKVELVPGYKRKPALKKNAIPSVNMRGVDDTNLPKRPRSLYLQRKDRLTLLEVIPLPAATSEPKKKSQTTKHRISDNNSYITENDSSIEFSFVIDNPTIKIENESPTREVYVQCEFGSEIYRTKFVIDSLIMEIMEEGNLMDRVRILLQRDMDYYQAHQTVLQENICPGVVGGLLDFPHYASFAAYKMILWWEEEYVAAFLKGSGLIEACSEPGGEPSEEKGCGGVVKTSAPAEFVSLTSVSASQLLEHLHTLSQEALDHADLTVLTGTLGAAALVKNCLWCYNEQLKKIQDIDPVPSLHLSHKQYHEMAEALAERLLDLHCRLLSLYVMQDADCLNWENPRPFFEGERGSFIIQMWWLYMQGTKEDLWNTVPPKMAQRVLAGMLNESLTILTVRYTQALPSSGRSPLLIADVTDLLLCVRQLLPAICSDADELSGHSPRNKVIKDVHAKCHRLLLCLLFRGCPLATLYKVFCKSVDAAAMYEPMRPGSPAAWFVLTSPHVFGSLPSRVANIRELPDGPAIGLALSVLVAQPQASWPLLVQVLMMRNCKVVNLILGITMKGSEESVSDRIPQIKPAAPDEVGLVGQCGGFLCSGGGDCSLGCRPDVTELPAGVIVRSLVHILVEIGGPNDFATSLLPALEGVEGWGGCLDRRQVWNQCRPPWLDALLLPLQPIVAPVVETVNRAMHNGASLEDATGLALDCFAHLIDALPPAVVRSSLIVGEALAADVRPTAGSVLLQWLLAELYSHLAAAGGNKATALAEYLCRLDENQAQAVRVRRFLDAVTESADVSGEDFNALEATPHMAEVLVSRLLLTSHGRRALKVLWQYLQYGWQWIAGQLGALEAGLDAPSRPPPIPAKASRPRPTRLLHTMFHMGYTNLDRLDWKGLLNMSLSLNREQVWMQLQWRADFRETTAFLSQHDETVVKTLKQLFEKS